MGDQVEQLRVVFAQGETADLGFQAWPAFDDEPANFTDLVVRKLHNVTANDHDGERGGVVFRIAAK